MYETGVAVAFLIWLLGLVLLVVQINSTLEQNLHKVGQRISWFFGQPKPASAAYIKGSFLRKVGKFLLIAAVTLPFVLLSWLQVIMFLGQRIYMWSKDRGAPQAIQEFRWKLRNIDMPLDQLVREMMKAAGQPDDMFDEVYKATLDDLRQQGLR